MTNRLLSLALGCAMAVSAFADQPFRDHRYDSFKATPTVDGQIVFAGNSITNMHSWFEAFGSHQEVVGRGNSGGFAYEMLDELENYIDGKPAKLFVMIGTNDISSGQSADITAKRIETIVTRTRLESPETEVYVESILPRSNNAKPDYEACNTLVSNWITAQNDPKVHFINLSTVCAGLNGNATWTYDGLHPRPTGYAAWTHHIEDQVGYPSVYPTTITSQDPCGAGNNSNGARVEQFPYFPVMEGDVLFFGDEQVHGGEWHELLRSNKIKDRAQCWGWGGINLTAAKAVVTASLKDQAVKPAKIFLFYGIGGTDETNYRALVDEAKAQAPQAKIYLVSLSPSANATTNSGRVSFNTVMQTVANEKGCTYVDVYTPLNADINSNIMGTNYISGRGYIVMANELAKYLTEEGVNPVSLAEYNALYARRTARKVIGDALTEAFMMNYGTEMGQIDIKYKDQIEACIPALVEKVNDPTLTVESATAAAATINGLITEAKSNLVKPMVSTDTEEHWYTLRSFRGTASYLTASAGKLVGAAAPGERTEGANVWKFLAHGEDAYDIVNANGQYISPVADHNTQMSVTTTVPTEGFRLANSDAAEGYFVIYTSACQLNQTNFTGAPVYNWYGTSTPNTADQGCAYYISLYDGEIGEPLPVEIPDTKITLLDVECDGEPYRIADELAAPILASETNTVAIHAIIDEALDVIAFAAATAEEGDEDGDESFFSFALRNNGRIGVEYIGQVNRLEGWYTQPCTMPAGTEVKIVLVNDEAAGYSWYIDGTLHRNIASGFGDYGFVHFGNVQGGNALYLGGLVTPGDDAKYPLVGTIYSARFWDQPLTAEQVAALPWTELAETEVGGEEPGEKDGINEIASERTDATIYDLQGRRVLAPTRGLYIANGQKIRI